MFKLRDQHLQAFSQAHRDEFFRRAVARLRFDCPDQTAAQTDDQLRKIISDSEERIAPFGLKSELQIVQYAEATLLLGGRFDERPEHAWAANVLRSNHLNPTQKGRLLEWTARHMHNDRVEAGG